MSTTAQPQTSIYEKVIEDDALEELLEERQKLKDAASIAQALYKEANDKAKAKAGELDLGEDAPVRCGRFVITRTVRKPRSVSFETGASVQLRIKPIEDE